MVENLTMHLTAIQSRNSTKVINCAPELSNTLQLCLNNRSTVKSKSDKNILKIFSMYSEVKVVSEIVSILRSPTLSGADKLSLLRLLSRIVNDFIVEPKQIVDQILLVAGPPELFAETFDLLSAMPFENNVFQPQSQGGAAFRISSRRLCKRRQTLKSRSMPIPTHPGMEYLCKGNPRC